MIKYLSLIYLAFFLLVSKVNAQSNQIVSSGMPTSPVSFGGTGCVYNWTNDNPAIGLAASGTGNIPSFRASNTGSTPIVATIKATPLTSGFAYISNVYSNSVSVISVAENKVIATIPVPGEPIGVCISPDGNKLYVVNSAADNISVINTSTNTIVKNIAVNGYSYGICVSADGSRVYVANYNNQTVGIINALTNTLISNVPAGYGPYNLCISPDGSRLYITNYDFHTDNPGTITVLNTLTNTIVAKITVGAQPEGIAINEDGSKVYVTNSHSNTVSVINTATNTNIATIPVGFYPRGIAISPDGNKLYTEDALSHRLMITDLSTNTSVLSAQVGVGSIGLSLTSDGVFAYVENQVDNTVTVINTITNAVVANIGVQTAPQSVGKFVSASAGCNAVTFTITVNPSPLISVGSITGSIVSCAGAASATPNIEQFSVSGNYLTNDVIVTAPSGIEVSSTPTSGYGNSISLSPLNGSITTGTVYVRGAAAVTGSTGDIMLTSTGAETKTITVTSVVHSLPSINVVANQEVKTGINIDKIDFMGTAHSYTWTNSLPQIGLPANGIGAIPSFTAINNGNTTLTAVVTVTPINSNGCEGNAISFKIIVDPNQPSTPDQSIASLIVPNTFTPNGDGINDLWEIKNINNYTNATVKIYDRYGQVVYSSKGYSKPWNGRNNNNDLPAGTYYYLIDPNENGKMISGYVAIIR
jgi:gliding motility-associated-like protein